MNDDEAKRVRAIYPPIVLQDEGVYTHEGAYIWWRAANKNLDNQRPVDLWWSRNEDLKRMVLDEVSRLTGGNG